MPLSKEQIGIRISNARKVMGLTQAELAERIGVSEKYLSRIENGNQVPSITIVARICEVLQISADKLLSLPQSTYSSNEIENAITDFSTEEKKQIIEVIKIIKEIKFNREFNR